MCCANALESKRSPAGNVRSSMNGRAQMTRGHGDLFWAVAARSLDGRASPAVVAVGLAVGSAVMKLQTTCTQLLKSCAKSRRGRQMCRSKRAICASRNVVEPVSTDDQSLSAKHPICAPLHDGRPAHDNQAQSQKALSWVGGRHPAKSVKQPARTGDPMALARAVEEFGAEGLLSSPRT